MEAGRLPKKEGYVFDVAFTSVLARAVKTLSASQMSKLLDLCRGERVAWSASRKMKTFRVIGKKDPTERTIQ